MTPRWLEVYSLFRVYLPTDITLSTRDGARGDTLIYMSLLDKVAKVRVQAHTDDDEMRWLAAKAAKALIAAAGRERAEPTGPYTQPGLPWQRRVGGFRA